MASRFEIGMKHLRSRMRAKAGVVVTIQRGIYSTIITTAWLGRTPFRIDEDNRSRLEWSERDYMISVEDYIINGVKVEPQRGDILLETRVPPDTSTRYVLSAPEGEKVWRYSDKQRLIYRIHTKAEAAVI